MVTPTDIRDTVRMVASDALEGVHKHLSDAMLALAFCTAEVGPPIDPADLIEVARLLWAAQVRLTDLSRRARTLRVDLGPTGPQAV